MFVKTRLSHALIFPLRLKTVDVLMCGLDEAESQVRMNESRLSEEDIVPADTAAIQNLRAQLGVRKRCHTISPHGCCFTNVFFETSRVRLFSLQKWRAELAEQEDIFQTLQSQVARAKEAAAQLSRLHPERSPELERYQERANQMAERWNGIKRQMETR